MSTNVFNTADVARLLGISHSQAMHELASWPHQRTGTEISFTADDVAEIKRLMNAGPEEQAARRQLIEQKRAEVRALDASDAPEPGIMGDYRESCVVCLQGTDTGLAVQGEAEVAQAVLQVMGVPSDQAATMAEAYFAEVHGCTDGMVPGGVITFPVRICKACAEESGTSMVPGLLPEVPVYSHGGGHR